MAYQRVKDLRGALTGKWIVCPDHRANISFAFY
jgi:hypothetical protein